MRLRNRIVKATFWTDPYLCRLPRDKRDFYQSLWACAEDSCCLEDDMFGIKLAAWPSPVDADMTVEKFEAWRDEFIADGKLVRYEADGDPYLYIPTMAEHEKPRNPQRPDCPLPPFVAWVENESDDRKGRYEHTHSVVEPLYYDATSVPAPPRPAPTYTETSPCRPKPVENLDGIHLGALGKLEEKLGRTADVSELRSLRTLSKKYSEGVVCLAISQAFVQINEGSSRVDKLFGLITTIAKNEAKAS